jgi:cytidylate kinase
MPVVTIRGQEGSGAPEIGRMVANKLRIDYVDNEIITGVAQKLNRREKDVVEKEMPPSTLSGRIARVLLAGVDAISRGYQTDGGLEMPIQEFPWETPLYDDRYLQILKLVITELANSQAIVIRGRGSQFILKGFPGALHIFVVAPNDIRIKRVMESLKLDRGEAKKEMDRRDISRREFTKRYFHSELENPLHYDLVINTEHISFEDATSIIIKAVSSEVKTERTAKSGKTSSNSK